MKQPLTNLVKIDMDELEEKAAPKATEMTGKLDLILKEMVINNFLLTGIKEVKEEQRIHEKETSEREIEWQKKWRKAKNASGRVTFAQVIIGSAALYLGVIDVNRDNAIVQSLTEAAISFMRMF